MRAFSLCITAVICLVTSFAHAAGVQFIIIPPEGDNSVLSGAVWSPCASPPQEVKLYGVATPARLNCPVQGDKLPLVVISHGQDGWFGGHHDTAEALADAGFVVAAINHPGDNGNDTSQSESLSVLASRPGDMIRLLDFMFDGWKDRATIDHAKIGMFGFSAG